MKPMDSEEQKAYQWSLKQKYQSVAASYSRILALYIKQCIERSEKMPEEKLYVGAKLIRAYPMDEHSFIKAHRDGDTTKNFNRPGYLVKYPDGYISWSPKDVFENAYREVTDSERELF